MSFIGSPSAFDEPRQPTGSSPKAEPLALEKTLQGIRDGQSIIQGDLLSLNQKLKIGGPIHNSLSNIADILENSAIARHSDSPLEKQLKKIEKNTSTISTPEKELETKQAEKIKHKEEKNQTSLLSNIWQSTKDNAKGKVGGIWGWFKDNWIKLLGALAVLKLPYAGWRKIWGVMGNFWKWIKSDFYPFLRYTLYPVLSDMFRWLTDKLFSDTGFFGPNGMFVFDKDTKVDRFMNWLGVEDLRTEVGLAAAAIAILVGPFRAAALVVTGFVKAVQWAIRTLPSRVPNITTAPKDAHVKAFKKAQQRAAFAEKTKGITPKAKTMVGTPDTSRASRVGKIHPNVNPAEVFLGTKSQTATRQGNAGGIDLPKRTSPAGGATKKHIENMKKVLASQKAKAKASWEKFAKRAGIKAGIRAASKAVPGVGVLAGTGFAGIRAKAGDWYGAILELGSGLTSLAPGPGTAIGAAINAMLLMHDLGPMQRKFLEGLHGEVGLDRGENPIMAGMDWNSLAGANGKTLIENLILSSWNSVGVPKGRGMDPLYTSGVRGENHPLYRPGSYHSAGLAFDLKSKHLGKWKSPIKNALASIFNKTTGWKFQHEGAGQFNAGTGSTATGEHFHFEPAAKGLHGFVKQPTLILAGEAGPEMVHITPNVSPDQVSAGMNQLHNERGSFGGTPPAIYNINNSTTSVADGDTIAMSPSVHNPKTVN